MNWCLGNKLVLRFVGDGKRPLESTNPLSVFSHALFFFLQPFFGTYWLGRRTKHSQDGFIFSSFLKGSGCVPFFFNFLSFFSESSLQSL